MECGGCGRCCASAPEGEPELLDAAARCERLREYRELLRAELARVEAALEVAEGEAEGGVSSRP
jgi:hypothetical protein